jgi:CheY-like chemotaxis protein
MVISVLERRAEIGLRRSLGATRGQIRLCPPRRCCPPWRIGECCWVRCVTGGTPPQHAHGGLPMGQRRYRYDVAHRWLAGLYPASGRLDWRQLKPAAPAQQDAARATIDGRGQQGKARHGCAILVAEDDPMGDVIRGYLERDGHQVRVVHDGREALEHARARRPDLLVLDVMMPGVDGLELCRILRAESDMPILLLTARRTEDDKLLGLDSGADDYMTKPFSPRELAARVRVLLRRAGKTTAEPPDVRTLGDLEIDAARFEVRVGPPGQAHRHRVRHP